MQTIWIVWEYDAGIRPEVYVYDVFADEKEARKCAMVMNSNNSGYFYEVEKFYVHTKFVPDNDE